MKKKFLSLFLASAMVVTALVGCTKKEEATDTGKSTENVEAVDVKKVFVTPEWVKSVIDGNQKESEKFLVVEAAWGTAKDSPDYLKKHIPGAVHVDTSSIEGEPLWNLKSGDEVKKALEEQGITKDTVVIVYGPDVSGTARMAFAYLWAGVENVKVLNGGLAAWEKAGYKTEDGEVKPTAVKDFGTKVPAHPEYVTLIEDAKKKLESDDNFKLVSIRSYKEFNGETSGYTYINKAGEPKGAVWGKGGTDPYNMDDYTNEDGTYLTMDQMLELWKDLEFTKDNQLAFYCGTGWRAAIPFLVMYDAGYTNMSVYDGGWFEWQSHDDYPVQVGDPKKDVKYTTAGELSNDKAEKAK